MKITKIVVHCSDTPDDTERRNHDAADIHRWHTERGWSGIGYHYVIDRIGDVQVGRPEYWKGAHVKGHNTGSIGICLIGRKHFEEDQLESLYFLIRKLMLKYNNPELYGHYELDERKTCPNFDVKAWYEDFNPFS